MSRWEYYLSYLPAVVFIAFYVLRPDHDVWWLFLSTWVVIHARAEQIRADIKGIK